MSSDDPTSFNPCYNPVAGQINLDGVPIDKYGNPVGSDYDLARDGAFAGSTIAVIHLYLGEGFDFSHPLATLYAKGFSVHRWTTWPTLSSLTEVLKNASQLWVISDMSTQVPSDAVPVIQKFFSNGHGVLIWGDNDPYNATATSMLNALFGKTVKLSGNTPGGQVLSSAEVSGRPGFLPHLVTSGLNKLFEGITIASLETGGVDDVCWVSLLRGSAPSGIVSAAFEKGGCRCIVDGGFTKLYINWDSAGTGRYVANAAAWLDNVERFVLGQGPNADDDDNDNAEDQKKPSSDVPSTDGSRCGVRGCSNNKCTSHFCKSCGMCPSDHLATDCLRREKKCKAVGCTVSGCVKHYCRVCGDGDADHRAVNCSKKSPVQKRPRDE
eukprot:PhM_4_TR17376/c0_g1_i1/m.22402